MPNQYDEDAIEAAENQLFKQLDIKKRCKRMMVLGGVAMVSGIIGSATGIFLPISITLTLQGAVTLGGSFIVSRIYQRKIHKQERHIATLKRQLACEKVKARENEKQQELGEARPLTTPEILAEMVTFHEKCSLEEKVLVRQAFHLLYEIPAIRPIMDVSAWMARYSKNPLHFRIAPNSHKKDFRIGDNTFGHAESNNIIAVSVPKNAATDPHAKRDLLETMIHEMAHSVIGEVKDNGMKSYDKGKGKKEAYTRAVDSDQAHEYKILTLGETVVQQCHHQPYEKPVYNPKKAWKCELDPRVMEEIFKFKGNDTILRTLSPHLLANTYQLLEDCKEFLQKKNYIPEMAGVTTASTTQELDPKWNTVTKDTLRDAILSRVKQYAIGTQRKLFYRDKGEKVVIAVDTFLTRITDHKDSEGKPQKPINFQMIYDNGEKGKEALHDFCDACAHAYQVAVKKTFFKGKTISVSKLKHAEDALYAAAATLFSVQEDIEVAVKQQVQSPSHSAEQSEKSTFVEKISERRASVSSATSRVDSISRTSSYSSFASSFAQEITAQKQTDVSGRRYTV